MPVGGGSVTNANRASHNSGTGAEPPNYGDEMPLIDTLTTFFQRPQSDTDGQTPDDVCANCWGHQKFDGKFRELARDKQIDITRGRDRNAFIQEFATKYVDGIRLKRTPDGKRCDACGNTHSV